MAASAKNLVVSVPAEQNIEKFYQLIVEGAEIKQAICLLVRSTFLKYLYQRAAGLYVDGVCLSILAGQIKVLNNKYNFFARELSKEAIEELNKWIVNFNNLDFSSEEWSQLIARLDNIKTDCSGIFDQSQQLSEFKTFRVACSRNQEKAIFFPSVSVSPQHEKLFFVALKAKNEEKDYNKTIRFFYAAIELKKKDLADLSDEINLCHTAIARTYNDHGVQLSAQKQYNLAREKFVRALDIHRMVYEKQPNQIRKTDLDLVERNLAILCRCIAESQLDQIVNLMNAGKFSEAMTIAHQRHAKLQSIPGKYKTVEDNDYIAKFPIVCSHIEKCAKEYRGKMHERMKYLNELAMFYYQQKQFKDARNTWNEAVRTMNLLPKEERSDADDKFLQLTEAKLVGLSRLKSAFFHFSDMAAEPGAVVVLHKHSVK